MTVQRLIVNGEHATVANMPGGYVKVLFDDGRMIIGTVSNEVKKYSPDQPRDEHGRFGSGGGTVSHTEMHDQTETPQFKTWFGNSKAVDSNGNPLVVYHGTLGDFSAFSPEHASVESDMGAGHYFTSSVEDANKDYATEEGADMSARLDRVAESISDVNNSGLDEASINAAKQQLGWVNNGAVLPVYLSMQNPVVIGTNAADRNEETKFTYSEKQDEEGEYTGEVEGTLPALMESLHDAAVENSGNAVDNRQDAREIGSSLAEKAIENDGEISASDVVNIFRQHERMQYSEDANGKMNSNDILRQAFQKAGFDGVIDNTVSKKFTGMKLDSDTTHYIAFDPKQIKSAIGNQGTFDPKDADITKGEDMKIVDTALSKGAQDGHLK